MSDPAPKTLPEQLDAARNDAQFGAALLGFMRDYEAARDAAEAVHL